MKTLSSATISRITKLLTPHRALMVSAMIALGLGSAVNLLFPEIIRRVINTGLLDEVANHPYLFGGGLIALFAFQGICFYLRIFLFGLIGVRVVTAVRANLFHSLIFNDGDLFDRHRSGDLVSRLMNDTSLLQDAVSVKFSVLVRYSLQVIVGFALMSYLSPRLTVIIFITLLGLVGVSIRLAKGLKTHSRELQHLVAKGTSVAEDAFSGIQIVKAFNAEHFIESLFIRVNNASLAVGRARILLSAFFQSFVNFLLNVALVGVFLYGISLAINHDLTFGDLTSFLLYGAIVAVSFAFAVSSYSELVQAVGGAERVFEFLSEEKNFSTKQDKTSESTFVGDITFSSVTFTYPSRPEEHALYNATFSIPYQKRTAIVGPSGSGKSTVTNLLCRFYDPLNGTISVGGTALTSLDKRVVRSHITLVPQDGRLFGLSIRQNLLLSNPEASETEMTQCCKDAAIWDFIQSLPLGFDTELGQKGTLLSGGERQRIAIARALLRKPDVLILDEATSALDADNEQKLQQALERSSAGRTTIVIAHRLSTIKDADHIIVLDSGKVVQQGTFKELVSVPGIFQDFVRIQERQAAA